TAVQWLAASTQPSHRITGGFDMTRSLTKWGLTAVLGVGLWVSTAGQASAQFMPGMRPGFTPGFMWSNPFNGMQFSYNSWQQSQWGLNWVNPYNGMRMSFGMQT